MPAESVETTSAEMGPSTIEQISLMTSRKSRPSLATSVGFVVTPSRTPQEAISRIWAMLAVSRKSFTQGPRLRKARGGKKGLEGRAANRHAHENSLRLKRYSPAIAEKTR